MVLLQSVRRRQCGVTCEYSTRIVVRGIETSRTRARILEYPGSRDESDIVGIRQSEIWSITYYQK